MTSFPANYLLRPAKQSDLPAIHQLMWDMAVFEQLTDIFKATPESLQQSFFQEPVSAHCLVITTTAAPDKPIAYIMWYFNYSSFLDKRGLYLEDIYIDPAHRGQGLGSAVLKRLASLAKDNDCGRFEWVVLDWNQNAIDFYERHGAQILPDWRIVRLSDEALDKLATA